MTITEALAEIKTILKRIQSKKEFIGQYLIRLENVKDPLEKDGGSFKNIEQELQAISDLEDRIVELRRNIQSANEANTITLEGVTKSISDWLTWRREVASAHESFLLKVRRTLDDTRVAQRRNFGLEKPQEIVVNVDEKKLSADIEKVQNILGQLDGQLSLKNATIVL